MFRSLYCVIVMVIGCCAFGVVPVTTAQSAQPVYPDETNTGVPSGVVLSKRTGTIEIDTDGTVLEAIDLVGNIVVRANDVTVRKSRITSATPNHLIYVMDGSKGFRLEDSELIGNGTTKNGVLGYGVFLRNDIHGFENGLSIWGPSHVERNFVHDLRGTPEAHFDAIEGGGFNIEIIGNTLKNENGQTSALMLGSDLSGPVDWVVDGNRMIGGGYTMYIDIRKLTKPISNVRITNNRWSKGVYGYNAFYGCKPDEWSGNIDDATGAPISP
jgi:hypothetical protein